MTTRCCIAGCGPAGAVAGFLLARAGVDVLVLEKHSDFLRDFRGDTIHPSTLEILDELGLKHSPIARKIVVAVIGGTIVLVGVVLLVTPGPATIVIPIGLVILASEFAWARMVLRRGKRAVEKARRGKWREAFSFARER